MRLCYRLTGKCPAESYTLATGAKDCKDPVEVCDTCLTAIGSRPIDCLQCANIKAACAVGSCKRTAVIDVACIELNCVTKISCCDTHIANRCNAHAIGVCSCKEAATLTLCCAAESCKTGASGCPECYGPPLYVDPLCAKHNGCAICNKATLTRYVACGHCQRAFLACSKCPTRLRTNRKNTDQKNRQILINASICPNCEELADTEFSKLIDTARMPPLVYIETTTTFCSKEVAPEEEWRIPVQHADGLARQMNQIANANATHHKNGDRGFEDKSYDMDLETVETCLCVTIMREKTENGHAIWIVVTHNNDRNTDLGTPFRRLIYDLRAYVMGDKFADVRQWYFARGAIRFVFAAPQSHPMLYHHRLKTSTSDWVILDANSLADTLKRDVWASGLYQGSTRKEKKGEKEKKIFDEEISDVSEAEDEDRKNRKREARWLYKKKLVGTYAKKSKVEIEKKDEKKNDENKNDENKIVLEDQKKDSKGEDDFEETVEKYDDENDEEMNEKSNVKRELLVEKRAREFGEARGFHIRQNESGTVFIDKDGKDQVNLHHAEVRGGAFAELLGAQILGIAATKGCCQKCQKTFARQLHLVCFDRQQQDRYNEYRNSRARNNDRIPTIDEVLATQQLTRDVVGGGGMCFFHSAVKILGNGTAGGLRTGLGSWLETANDKQLTSLFDLQKDDISTKLGCNSLAEYATHLKGDNDTWGYSVTVAALAKWKNLHLIVLVWNEEGVDERASPIGRISKTDEHGPNDGTLACVINTRPRYFADHFEPVTAINQMDQRTQSVDGYYARKDW